MGVGKRKVEEETEAGQKPVAPLVGHLCWPPMRGTTSLWWGVGGGGEGHV